jgi:aromatic-L-amino-acid decarboxylase
MDYGIQLGRRFRALKAWVIWRSLGRQGIVARLREQIRLANLLANWIKNDNPEIIGAREDFRSRFKLAAPVSMGVVCFRFIAGDESSRRSEAKADINSQIVERINASGRAYLTQTKLHGQTVMRIGFGNVLTTEKHLRQAWELIRDVANEVDSEK